MYILVNDLCLDRLKICFYIIYWSYLLATRSILKYTIYLVLSVKQLEFNAQNPLFSMRSCLLCQYVHVERVGLRIYTNPQKQAQKPKSPLRLRSCSVCQYGHVGRVRIRRFTEPLKYSKKHVTTESNSYNRSCGLRLTIQHNGRNSHNNIPPTCVYVDLMHW